jgi:hypothetical protein
MEAGMPQGSVLSPILYNLYINDTPQATNLHLALFADDTCLYATDRKEGYKQTPWPLVRERTIPTDRPPLVDEI